MAERTRKQRQETCPITGFRDRRSDCVLGKKAREDLDRENAKLLARGEQMIDMFDLAGKEGSETLARIKDDLFQVQLLARGKEEQFSKEARQTVLNNLRSQESHVSADVREMAVEEAFKELCRNDKDCKKAYGISKAVDSLKKYLRVDLPRMHKDYKTKRAAAEEKSKEAQAEKQEQQQEIPAAAEEVQVAEASS